MLDDATDPSAAVKNTHKLINENMVDVVIGSSITPSTLEMIDVVAEKRTPLIALAASSRHRRTGQREARLGLQDSAE